MACCKCICECGNPAGECCGPTGEKTCCKGTPENVKYCCNEEACCNENEVCCSSPARCCPEDYACCGEENCCEPGTVCCGDTSCCAEGQHCCDGECQQEPCCDNVCGGDCGCEITCDTLVMYQQVFRTDRTFEQARDECEAADGRFDSTDPNASYFLCFRRKAIQSDSDGYCEEPLDNILPPPWVPQIFVGGEIYWAPGVCCDGVCVMGDVCPP